MTTSPAVDGSPQPPQPTPNRGPWPGVAAGLAFLLMAPIGFFYAVSGLLVPGPWVYFLWLLYPALLVVAMLLGRRRSYWVLAVPVVGAGLWFGIVSAGEAWLGWTA